MIILNLKKFNTNFKENTKIYLNITNFGPLECPNPECHSHEFIKWGGYERNVIFFSGDNKSLESQVLKVQRVKCKGCGKTHALIPIGIIPYKQFTDEVVSKVLLDSQNNDIEIVSSKYSIDQSIIKKWNLQFIKYHKSKVEILTMIHNQKQALINFINNTANKIKYITNYNQCFMQIKLGCLGLVPRLGGAPT